MHIAYQECCGIVPLYSFHVVELCKININIYVTYSLYSIRLSGNELTNMYATENM
jgi:hypothetical protein